MFAHALKLSTQFTSAEVTRRIADATAEVCSGEIMQTQRRFDLNLSVADYFKIIEMKTAALFGVATELGARLNEASPQAVEAMKVFGLKLGIAYQIYDDCLDLAGDESKAGKTLGSDLRKGKLTLPLLHLLRECDEARRARWSEVILSGNGVEALVREVSEQGALEVAVTTARGLLGEAREQLEALEESPFRRGLTDLCRSVDRLLRQF